MLSILKMYLEDLDECCKMLQILKNLENVLKKVENLINVANITLKILRCTKNVLEFLLFSYLLFICCGNFINTK